MEPLMNAPQWFLEREDSVELLVLLSKTFKDPVVALQDVMTHPEHTIVAILEKWKKADVMSFDSIKHLEDHNQYLRKKVRCIYDIKNDMYISIKER
jgi:hypothetical protein